MKKLIFVLMFLSQPVFAQTKGFEENIKGFYTRFDAGIGVPRDEAFKENAVIRMGFGKRFNDHLRFDFMIERQRFRMKGNRFTPNDIQEKSNGRVLSDSAFITGYWDLFSLGFLTPYIGIGGGVTRNRAYESTIGSFLYKKSSKNALAFQMTAGIGFSLPKGLVLDIAYTHADLRSFRNRRALNPVAFNISTPRKEALRTSQFTLGLRFHF